ncbi:MAG TPA: hypothetical protein VK119_07220 [Bacillota bacterium]|nr:hypothetical protein [Bacillota bacterium]
MLMTFWLLVQAVQFSRFHILGVHNGLGYLIVTSIGLVSSYLIIRPIILYLINVQSVRLLTYLVSSFLLTMIGLAGSLLLGNTETTKQCFKSILQTNALFGGGLLLYHATTYFLFSKKKRI